MNVIVLIAIVLAGTATSMLTDTWLPSWAASLSGLAVVLVLLWLRRRRDPKGGRGG